MIRSLSPTLSFTSGYDVWSPQGGAASGVLAFGGPRAGPAVGAGPLLARHDRHAAIRTRTRPRTAQVATEDDNGDEGGVMMIMIMMMMVMMLRSY
jgi:hypothetical protein